MPRKQRHSKLRENPFAGLDGPDWLTLLAGWTPPRNERERLATKFKTLEDCRQAWAVHGDCPSFTSPCGRRSWSWWTFSTPEPPDPTLTEYQQLARWGLLSAENIRYLRSRFDDEMKRYRLLGREDFNALEEGEGLMELQILSLDERKVVRAAEDAQAANAAHGKDNAEWPTGKMLRS